jgi:integration host factor subunit alpha
MTKANLAQAIYKRHGGLSVLESQEIIDVIFKIIKKQLLSGDNVHIVGFGTLEAHTRRARRGRDPVTGTELQLPARKVLVLRPSRAMKSI